MLPEQLSFQAVHETFRPQILRYLAARIGQDAAEDVAQDVFVRIYAALPRFRGESQLSTWIYRIASNGAVDWLRASSHRRPAEANVSVELMSDAEDERVWADIDAPSADQQMLRQEMSECVQAFIGELPETYRTALLASEEGRLRDADAARLLGLSRGAFKIRLHRARAKLREQLEANCSFARDEYNRLTCETKGD